MSAHLSGPVRGSGPLRSRRDVLRLGGALAVGGLLAACSDSTDSTDSSGAGNAASSDTGPADGFVLATRYPVSKALTPGEMRLAVSLADRNASLITGGPATISGVVRDEQGTVITEFEAPRRGTGLGVPYWSITTSIPKAGLYDLKVEGATGDPAAFLVWDPSEVTVPSPTMALPPFDTPTFDDARGVDPVCSRSLVGDGPCPFHEVTLTEALRAGLPVVYLVGTPAFCQTGTCGPGLDFLIESAKGLTGKATFVHAEVYADDKGTEVAPAVDAAGLDYEPVIWVTDATGTITRRIDIVWDQDELTSLLTESLT